MDSGGGEIIAPEPTARWQQAADRLGRYAWLVLLAATVVALIGGIISATTEGSNPAVPKANVDECVNPPCFGVGGMPSFRDLPVVVPILGYLLAIVLALPSLFAGGWDLRRGRWASGGRRLLAGVGPVLFLAGTEILPHLLSPCLPATLGADWLPPICERTAAGVDIRDRWHALDYALVGALPLTALYWLARRRWHPDLMGAR